MPWIHRIHPEVLRFGGTFAIRWYGISYLAAFLLGYFLLRRLLRQGLLPMTTERLQDFLAGICVFGVMLGGRLGYFLFYEISTLWENPLQLLKVWEGGMSSHGGMLGCLAYLLWWARRERADVWVLGDNFVTVVPLGLGLGRLANFINGELWGRAASVPWAMVFPLERPEFQPGGAWERYRYDLGFLRGALDRGWLTPRHPSQLYQAFAEGFVLFGLLWWLRHRAESRRPGRLCAVFFAGYGLARFGMEFFREPDAAVYFGWMTTGQLLTMGVFVAAGVCAAKGWSFRAKAV